METTTTKTGTVTYKKKFTPRFDPFLRLKQRLVHCFCLGSWSGFFVAGAQHVSCLLGKEWSVSHGIQQGIHYWKDML